MKRTLFFIYCTDAAATIKHGQLETEIIRKINEENKDDVLLFSIVEVGADNGVTGDAEKLENGKVRIITRSTFSPLKEVPASITVKAYNPSELSESVKFKVPLKK
jgi:hypothetical protein